MSKRQRKALKAVAAFLVFSIAQISIPLSRAAEGSGPSVLPIPQQLIVARLERVRGGAITVNGNGVTSGATITTASVIETGADTGATVNLGSLGTLDIAPNTRLELTYDDKGNVKIKLYSGCAILRTKKNTNGEVTTETDQSVGKNPKEGGILDVCIPPGGAPIVNQGAAAAAGAGAAPAAAAAAGGGLPTAAWVAIIGGAAAAVAVPIAVSQGNNCNTNP